MAPRKILNQYDFYECYVVGHCTNGGEFLIDIDDYDRIKEYSWRRQNGTVYTNISRGNPISLGRFILNKGKNDFKVLFKNKNSFDFRKENLFSGNKYVNKGAYYEVYCYGGKSFLIDKEDYSLVSKLVWHVDKGGYVIAKNKTKVIKLHRYVLGVYDSSEPEIDHRNRNKCDNRKQNLRFSDRSTNCINKGLLSSNKSGKSGVCWNKSINKWVSQINKDGHRYYLGCFDLIEDAIQVRIAAEKALHKDHYSI